MVNWILNGIGKALWYLLVAPILLIIDGFEKIFNFLVFDLFQIIIFQQKKVDVSNFPPQFYYFVAFAFLIAVFLFFYQIIQGYLHSGERLWTNFIVASKMFIKSFGLIMLIPLIIIALLFLYKGAAFIISLIFTQQTTTEEKTPPIVLQIKYLAYSGTTFDWKKSAEVETKTISEYPPDWFTSSDWNPIISIISAWTTIYMFYTLASTIMLKYFKVLGLAITAPVPVIMQIRDEGQKLQSWKNMFLENIFGVLGVYLGYFFFILGMKLISDIPRTLTDLSPSEYNAGISNYAMIIMLGMLMGLVLSVSAIAEWFGDLFVLQNPNATTNNATRTQVAKKMAVKSAATLKAAAMGGVVGIAATGILGKTAKHSSRNRFSQKWTNSIIGNSLNNYRTAKSQALNDKSQKAAKKADQLNLKANKALTAGKSNKAHKLDLKANKAIKKFDKSLTKSDKLQQKVKKFNQTKNVASKE